MSSRCFTHTFDGLIDAATVAAAKANRRTAFRCTILDGFVRFVATMSVTITEIIGRNAFTRTALVLIGGAACATQSGGNAVIAFCRQFVRVVRTVTHAIAFFIFRNASTVCTTEFVFATAERNTFFGRFVTAISAVFGAVAPTRHSYALAIGASPLRETFTPLLTCLGRENFFFFK